MLTEHSVAKPSSYNLHDGALAGGTATTAATAASAATICDELAARRVLAEHLANVRNLCRNRQHIHDQLLVRHSTCPLPQVQLTAYLSTRQVVVGQVNAKKMWAGRGHGLERLGIHQVVAAQVHLTQLRALVQARNVLQIVGGQVDVHERSQRVNASQVVQVVVVEV